jgi:sulfite exporter TauE/SafE
MTNVTANGLIDSRRGVCRDYLETAAAFVVVIGILLALGQLDVLPRQFGFSETISYGLVFVVGLVASVSSCIAVTGGLLVAIAAKYNEAAEKLTPMQRLKPHLYFNAGRILSYTLFGGAVGALGSTLILSPQINGLLTLAASLVMVLLGLQMLRLLSGVTRLLPTLPKSFGHLIHDLAERDANGGAFALGAATFFLPCGFTQALQLYVLSKGSFTIGALTMLVFSLGTLPALVSLSAISSLAQGGLQRHFLKLAGAAVIILGVANVQNGLVLTSSMGSAAPAQGERPAEALVSATDTIAGRQIVEMRIEGHDYRPNRFAVKQGIPVEWRIESSRAALCGRYLVSPGLGIRKLLLRSTTIVSFVPQETGEFGFNCGMGMMTPGSKFTVVPNARG